MARTAGVSLDPLVAPRPLGGRLGLNVPKDWWPTAATLKSFEAAGYRWVQVHSPPRAVLRRPEAADHARALRAALDVGGLRVVVHGPDDLVAGEPESDRALDGVLEYAARVRAELVVYHGANFPLETPGRRRRAELRSLRRAAFRAGALQLTVAVENLAPVHPGPPRICHDPLRVVELVEAVGSGHVGMCFDIGHAHIVGALDALDAALTHLALVHLHDNLGDTADGARPATVDPLRLDLHLPPGTGTVPWTQLAPRLHALAAPLQLEIHPPHRPRPIALASITAELLARATYDCAA